MDSENKEEKIKKMVKNITYFDQYSGSVFLFIVITLVLLFAVSYCYIMSIIQPIQENWPIYRCKPYVIPFAGLINTPAGTTATDFTKQNFDYCTQSILQNITGDAVAPLTFATKATAEIADGVKDGINDIRGMFNKVRTYFTDISEEIYGRLQNIMIPLQQIIVSCRDFIGKIQGTVTASLFTLLGSYYTLKSLLGAIAQFIVTILIAMAALIAVFWIFPFTWGAAISGTATFVAVSIPLAIILSFMTEVLHIHTNLSIPHLPTKHMKCFDKNTLFRLKNGIIKKACDIRLGDEFASGVGRVTAKIKVLREGSVMYNLHGVIVSNTHKVMLPGSKKSIFVSEHPDAKKIPDSQYRKKYLYCFNTTSKTLQPIVQKGNQELTFLDWDDLDEETLDIVLVERENLYCFDVGYTDKTQIELAEGKTISIASCKPGQRLWDNQQIIGTVECFQGINLVTETGSFLLFGGEVVQDYNSCIDNIFSKREIING